MPPGNSHTGAVHRWRLKLSQKQEYETHPLCALFPRITESEFSALRSFSCIRRDRLGIADFRAADDESGYWHFSIFDVPSKQQVKSLRPIAGVGVALLLDQYGGRSEWVLTTSAENKRQAMRERDIVYFLQAGPFIKIGKTIGCATNRVAQLQTGCPFPIKIISTINGDRSVESGLHRRFSKCRAHGEWFHATPELMDYINKTKDLDVLK